MSHIIENGDKNSQIHGPDLALSDKEVMAKIKAPFIPIDKSFYNKVSKPC